MVLDNHAECKTALLGLLDALGKIKRLAEQDASSSELMKPIHQLASDAVQRHGSILPRI